MEVKSAPVICILYLQFDIKGTAADKSEVDPISNVNLYLEEAHQSSNLHQPQRISKISMINNSKVIALGPESPLFRNLHNMTEPGQTYLAASAVYHMVSFSFSFFFLAEFCHMVQLHNILLFLSITGL